MIARYTLPAMGKIWEENNRFRCMLDVELFACEAMVELGLVPQDAYAEIREKASFDVARIQEIEKTTRHTVVAFLQNISENVGESSKYLHMGLTASDVLDTALAVQMQQSCDLLLNNLRKLRGVLAGMAKKYKYTLMIGRTHGMHAEPITFGLKMALWTMEIDRHIKRLNAVRENVSVGKISGAVGTFANVEPQVEEHVCRSLGLYPAYVSTQVLQRDRHAELVSTLALIGGSLEKFATEIRNLQRTDILEVEEDFAEGQKGSSAMPHKINPIASERIVGLSRILRGNALAMLEEIALWHERDNSHSSVERIALPDSCILLDYMLYSFTHVMQGLRVFPENMEKNINATRGLIFSQRVLLALVEKGVLRETAYDWVQRNALNSWENEIDFEYLVLEDKDISAYLSREEIMDLFDMDYHTKNIDYIFARAGLN